MFQVADLELGVDDGDWAIVGPKQQRDFSNAGEPATADRSVVSDLSENQCELRAYQFLVSLGSVETSLTNCLQSAGDKISHCRIFENIGSSVGRLKKYISRHTDTRKVSVPYMTTFVMFLALAAYAVFLMTFAILYSVFMSNSNTSEIDFNSQDFPHFFGRGRDGTFLRGSGFHHAQHHEHNLQHSAPYILAAVTGPWVIGAIVLFKMLSMAFDKSFIFIYLFNTNKEMEQRNIK
jgi:hypothetical protein